MDQEHSNWGNIKYIFSTIAKIISNLVIFLFLTWLDVFQKPKLVYTEKYNKEMVRINQNMFDKYTSPRI